MKFFQMQLGWNKQKAGGTVGRHDIGITKRGAHFLSLVTILKSKTKFNDRKMNTLLIIKIH